MPSDHGAQEGQDGQRGSTAPLPMPLPEPAQRPQLVTHHAALHVTGWLGEGQRGKFKGQIFIQGLPVALREEDHAFLGSRVSLTVIPRTDLWGNLTDATRALHLTAAPEGVPNGTRLSVLGKLRRVDLSEQLVILHVFRDGRAGKHFSVRLRGSPRLLKAIPPELPTLHVTGSLVGRMLLLEDFQPYPLHPARPGEARRWVDEWELAEGLGPHSGLTTRVIGRGDRLRRAASGRCYLNGKPFRAADFEALLRAGCLWQP